MPQEYDHRPQAGDEARRAALSEARQRLSEAESLVLAGAPGCTEALEHARDALTRSSYPPEPPEPGRSEANLRARLSAFLRSLG